MNAACGAGGEGARRLACALGPRPILAPARSPGPAPPRPVGPRPFLPVPAGSCPFRSRRLSLADPPRPAELCGFSPDAGRTQGEAGRWPWPHAAGPGPDPPEVGAGGVQWGAAGRSGAQRSARSRVPGESAGPSPPPLVTGRSVTSVPSAPGPRICLFGIRIIVG